MKFVSGEMCNGSVKEKLREQLILEALKSIVSIIKILHI